MLVAHTHDTGLPISRHAAQCGVGSGAHASEVVRGAAGAVRCAWQAGRAGHVRVWSEIVNVSGGGHAGRAAARTAQK